MPGLLRPQVGGARRLCLLAGLFAIALVPQRAAAVAPEPPSLLPASFTRIQVGPDGGSLWQGRIPDRTLPQLQRPSVVYLPPHPTPDLRYPVLYLLHGFRGSPWQFSSGLQLATVADRAIVSGAVRPFIAVAPPAGLTSSYAGEWAGPWERYLVRDVLPWVDAHLPAGRGRSQRAIAGLSAGGFGAVDIGLRHPGLFGTLESWSGYFTPLRDGPFRHARPRTLAAHDPTLLVQRDAARLRRLGTRFYLSCGTTDRKTSALAYAFAGELGLLGLRHTLNVGPGGHNGRFWLSQFPRALRYALPALE